MKKLIILIALAFASCNTVPVDKDVETSHRIIGKEYNIYEGHSYQIIEVDGHEFLCQYNGGMCLIPKDTLKK